MRKKTLIVLGVFLAFFVIQGCTSAPEKTLLKKYFNSKIPCGVLTYLPLVTRETVDSCISISSATSFKMRGRR